MGKLRTGHTEEQQPEVTEHQFKMKVTDAASNGSEKENDSESTNQNNSNSNSLRPAPYDRAFREHTKTEWQASDLQSLKESMKEKMQEMVTKQKMEAIAKMAERNDAIREPAEQSSSELIQPHGYGHDTSSEFDREAKAQRNKEEMKQKLQEMAFKEKQAKISQMAERNDAIREQSG